MEKKRLEEVRTAVKDLSAFMYYFRLDNFHNSNHNGRRHTQVREHFFEHCNRFEAYLSDDDDIWKLTPSTLDGAKQYSFKDVKEMTDNFNMENLISWTRYGRLFKGFIRENDECDQVHQVAVKTWDFLFPYQKPYSDHLSRFCNELEILTNEEYKPHPSLMKLHGFCFHRVLALVYDEKPTKYLWQELELGTNFGWNDRMKVAIQLADLFAWLHEKRMSFGCVTPSSVAIDEDYNIKVFDFGLLAHVRDEDNGVPVPYSLGFPDGPEVEGIRTLKADVYVFGVLLVNLITTNDVFCDENLAPQRWIERELQSGKRSIVDKSLLRDDDDDELTHGITMLAAGCLELEPSSRPEMKCVYTKLSELGTRRPMELDPNAPKCRKCLH